MWSGNNFKSTVSPQELVQEVSVESKRRFSIGQRAECLDLLVWLLGTLNKGLGKAANAISDVKPSRSSVAAETSSSVVYEPFQVRPDAIGLCMIYDITTSAYCIHF